MNIDSSSGATLSKFNWSKSVSDSDNIYACENDTTIKVLLFTSLSFEFYLKLLVVGHFSYNTLSDR